MADLSLSLSNSYVKSEVVQQVAQITESLVRVSAEMLDQEHDHAFDRPRALLHLCQAVWGHGIPFHLRMLPFAHLGKDIRGMLSECQVVSKFGGSPGLLVHSSVTLTFGGNTL